MDGTNSGFWTNRITVPKSVEFNEREHISETDKDWKSKLYLGPLFSLYVE